MLIYYLKDLVGGSGRRAFLSACALTLLVAAGCRPPSGDTPVEKCYKASQACERCCDLLDGMLAEKCTASCECQLTCCKEEAGVGQVGACSSCEAMVEVFECEEHRARDDDNDGYSEYEGDCDDENPEVNPEMEEEINGVDDNCDGYVDEDLDGDGFTTNGGDCDDEDPAINPYATEMCNDGIDNNCDGFTDENEPDADGDGFGPCAGDCNDSEPGIGPGAVEDPTDGLDNDCDGEVDEERTGCDCVDPSEGSVDMLQALEICNPNTVLDLQTYGHAEAVDIFEAFGAIIPRTLATHDATGLLDNNCRYLMLCSGIAGDTDPQNASGLGLTDPDPLGNPEDANDLAQVIVQFQVPHNVQGFSFDFIFLSSEYPEFVCSQFNDTFYAIEVDPGLNGGAPTNVSFDGNGNEITVNNNFFEDPDNWTQDLTGTGYDVTDTYTSCNPPEAGCTPPDPCPQIIGSGTGWLRTTSPVTPGEIATVTFSIHDEGDNILDSCVIVDNFRWLTTPVDGPGTVK